MKISLNLLAPIFVSLFCISALGQNDAKTLLPQDGAIPWFDRADAYTIADVPKRLQGTEAAGPVGLSPAIARLRFAGYGTSKMRNPV